jgi:hypothetical protein
MGFKTLSLFLTPGSHALTVRYTGGRRADGLPAAEPIERSLDDVARSF